MKMERTAVPRDISDYCHFSMTDSDLTSPPSWDTQDKDITLFIE